MYIENLQKIKALKKKKLQILIIVITHEQQSFNFGAEYSNVEFW